MGEELLEAMYKTSLSLFWMFTQHKRPIRSRICSKSVTSLQFLCQLAAPVLSNQLMFPLIGHLNKELNQLQLHMQDNLESYLNGKFTAGERRNILTNCKWVGQAWTELLADKEMVVRSFKNVAFGWI